MSGEREVTAVRRGERARCRLRWSQDGDAFTVEAGGPWGVVMATADDAFGALAEVRRRLEAEGWLLAVAGARRDAYPSGMLREMGGEEVYLLVRGQPADRRLGTFSDAPPDAVTTVDEQREAYEEWWKSV
jgi:hypothetical protein